MTVQVWSVEEFLEKAEEHAAKEFDRPADAHSWVDAVRTISRRAITRGDGVAVYENADLGHPDIGQWQIVSYGSEASQLETRDRPVAGLTQQKFEHGKDHVPTTLPDIGQRINWRYQLHAIVPSYDQLQVVENQNELVRPVGEAANDPRVPCCERDAADCDCTVMITLPKPELLELRRVWRTGDDALLENSIVRLVRDIFDGHDGDLQKLADL